MRNRLLVAILFVPLLILFVIWGGRPFFFFISAIGLMGLFEFYRIIEVGQIKPLTFLGMLIGIALLLAIYAGRGIWTVITVGVMITFLYHMGRKNFPRAITNCAVTIFGLVYVIGLLGYLLALMNLNGSRSLVFAVWFITWIGDSGAFAVGRSWGKHKLFPRISPYKTIEGAIGGVVSAMLAGLVAYFALGAIFRSDPFPLSHALPLGFALGIVGILGDLSESLLKRDAEVKDSGGKVPGHGGILDAFDSLLFTAPVMYYYAKFILHR